MVKFAEDANVLIHDSTFDSESKDIAKEYGHSTSDQCAKIAKKANVKQLYLTHISPRYHNYNLLEEDAKKIFKNTIVASDFQEVEVKYKI